MLGSIIVALITVSLLITGVVIVNLPQKSADTEDVESYNEGFFGNLGTLADKLGQSAERGGKTRVDRYQEYLLAKERAAEASRLAQQAVPDTVIPPVPKPSAQQTKPETQSLPAATSIVPGSSQSQMTAVPTLPQIAPIVPKPPVPQPEPEPRRETERESAPKPPVPVIPPPSSVGADDLSTRLEDFLSGFDLDYLLEEDTFDESDDFE